MEVQEAPVVEYHGEGAVLPEKTETPEISLRDQIKAVAEGVKARPEEAIREQRSRDEKGRFAGRAGEEQAVEQKPAIAPKVAEKPVEQPKEAAPPSSWNEQAKAAWGALPPDVRQAIAKREEEVQKGMTRHDGELNLGRQIKEVATQFDGTIQAVGMPPHEIFRNYLAIERTLQSGTPEQKKRVLIDAAKAYGIDLGAPSNTPSPDEYVDPQLQTLMEQVSGLQKQLDEERGYRQQQSLDANTKQVEAFAADAAHPHFDAVAPEMILLIRAAKEQGKPIALQEAYEKACWANPDIRSSLLKEQEDKRVADAKAKADAARRAGSSVTGAPGPTIPVKPDVSSRSLREELKANLRAAQHG